MWDFSDPATGLTCAEVGGIDPKNKAKSVVLTPEGLERARVLFERHFA